MLELKKGEDISLDKVIAYFNLEKDRASVPP